jgi:FecR protein
MKRVWHSSSKVLAGLFLAAMYAMPQAYTVSARPGAVNYIEGHASLNGREISQKTLGKTFLNANDTLSTDLGKAEVLLTPGVFLRIGDNSAVRMVSPSLTNTQVEITKGEAMVEVADILKDNNIEILARGGSMRLEKAGLYRVTADDPPTAAVIEGKAEVNFGDRKVDLGKGHQTVLAANLKSEKFNAKKDDDLYAWSNVRSEYDAGASYASARSATVNSYNNNSYGGWAGYPGGGFGYGFGPGWYYNGLWNSWAWMPANGYFFSPFGWGFYSPSYIAYAPVIYAPVGGRTAPVPVNTKRPPAVVSSGSAIPRSPAALNAARAQTARSMAAAQSHQSGAARQSGGPRMAAPASAGRSGGFSAPSAAPAPSAGARSSPSHR